MRGLGVLWGRFWRFCDDDDDVDTTTTLTMTTITIASATVTAVGSSIVLQLFFCCLDREEEHVFMSWRMCELHSPLPSHVMLCYVTARHHRAAVDQTKHKHKHKPKPKPKPQNHVQEHEKCPVSQQVLTTFRKKKEIHRYRRAKNKRVRELNS